MVARDSWQDVAASSRNITEPSPSKERGEPVRVGSGLNALERYGASGAGGLEPPLRGEGAVLRGRPLIPLSIQHQELERLFEESDALEEAIQIAESMEQTASLRSLQRGRRFVEERIAGLRGEG